MDKQLEKEILILLRKVLNNPSERKKGINPFEFYDFVNKGYLEQNGTTANRPTPTSTEIGRQYFNTTTGKPNFWNGSSWVLADGTGA